MGARASIPIGTRAIGLGLALSSGAYAAPDEGFYLIGGRGHRIYSWDRAQTLYFEVSTESGSSREERLSPRPFVGLGYVLNGGEGLCITGGYAECSGPGIARVIPYAGIALDFGIL
ncbi:MAG TPA: hypothetical protein VLT33_03700 [Labilithrix sp.]|nr:hypothetical protein [Labilithrix sp.]